MFVLIFSSLFISASLSLFSCPKKMNPPKQIIKNESFTINPLFKGKKLSIINIKNRIFIKQSQNITVISDSYQNKDYCPTDFIIPTVNDYKSLLTELGTSSYSILTNKKGFNMPLNVYYLTTNNSKTDRFSYQLLYIQNGNVKIGEFNIRKLGKNQINIRCIFNPPTNINLVLSNKKSELPLNTTISFSTNGKYFNGYLWKIDDKTYTNSLISMKFLKSGIHRVQFWGNLLNNKIIYLCDTVFVKKKKVLDSQTLRLSNVKLIETNYSVNPRYDMYLFLNGGSCHVAPRINGGYYVAFSDNYHYLNILSFDRNDKLIKAFNTTELAEILDITSTDYGFAYYAAEYESLYHAYIKLYNKNFQLINTAEIMNNKETDNNNVVSKKNINDFEHPYDSLKFIYAPFNGKMVYSRGRIFLIFGHISHLASGDHDLDTSITYNDLLKDLDFAQTWGASHSLVQSATFDDDYFWTASLSDGYPNGIKVIYTSKIKDKLYPTKRIFNVNDNLAGYIKGVSLGRSLGNLGGILYFEKLSLYALVYAKNPKHCLNGDNSNCGKPIIYVTTWKLSNGKIISNQTKEIIIFDDAQSLIRFRAGKYGNDKIFIMFSGYIHEGPPPNVTVIQLPNFNCLVDNKIITNIVMNSAEDLRTFDDGVLIWASTQKDKLVINKIGTPRLDDSYDDITHLLTKQDLIDYDKDIA